jgi:hypothetical protein
MASTIVTPEQFIPADHLLYTKPKVNASGGKSVGIINSNTRRSLMVSTPLMMNWGVNIYEKEGGNSYSISLQFPREEFSNPQINKFLSMLKDMEEQLKADALKHSRDWFGKQMTKDGIDLIWNPILKYKKDKDNGLPDLTSEPTLKVKLPVWDNEYKFELFDVNNELLIPNSQELGPDAFINKGSNIACILQCGGIWFANNNFGVSWKLYQGVVKPSETLKKGKCHIMLSGSDKEQIKTDALNSSDNDNNAKSSVSHDVTVESDDEGEYSDFNNEETSNTSEQHDDEGEPEQEQEQEPEPEPEPEPEKPKKKRVVKKKST